MTENSENLLGKNSIRLTRNGIVSMELAVINEQSGIESIVSMEPVWAKAVLTPDRCRHIAATLQNFADLHDLWSPAVEYFKDGLTEEMIAETLESAHTDGERKFFTIDPAPFMKLIGMGDPASSDSEQCVWLAAVISDEIGHTVEYYEDAGFGVPSSAAREFMKWTYRELIEPTLNRLNGANLL